MKCLCEENFKCSACQEKAKEHGDMFEKAAAYVAGLDEGDLIEFIQEVYMHSPNVEKLYEIKIAAQAVLEGLQDIEEIA